MNLKVLDGITSFLKKKKITLFYIVMLLKSKIY